ncbi:hypothetical protein TMatcc_002510 [Talaromyces marneffei ATCC 18224]|uniref:Purple acid phosphatase n=2 Tax=Talaromyces marneffei TaxID=37727 RepID=B6QKE0_TALMQ|nr:uncharacterized protein EYB26_006350 [Talaromyces marneffei]EEA23634.1 conserved hypothetical protein [Talaromyces marneffei ATCC 18224]KAE8552462.1 hypothetical protein EYB25_006356 [Talaromyces marneffei]QGA18665.1 hypothetical protein EYB26_006350 [Talaromyces marneffei]
MKVPGMTASLMLAAGLLSSGSAACDDIIPMQVRLAYAGPKGMVVSWNTFSELERPVVHYGRFPDALIHEASSDVSVTYPTSTTYNNHVTLQDLEEDTVYYYLPEHSNATEPYTFRTSRRAGDKTPFAMAVVVDMGLIGPGGLSTRVGNGGANPLGPNDTNTIQSLEQNLDGIDFIWHPGDIAYADYWLKEEIQGYLPNTTISDGYKVYESLLNHYYDEITPLTSVKPYMVGPGNHEANCDNGGTTDKSHNISYTVDICVPGQTNFTGYINHFRMPSPQSGGLGNFWYSFDHGMVHYIQLDTETDLGHGFISPDEPGGPESENSGPFSTLRDAQTNWLQKDLADVDRKKTPWVVVSGHRPWYVSASNRSSTICEECREVFEPLFLQYHVDLVLSGHVHAYERNSPMAHFDIDPKGLDNPSSPWYITNGAAGHYDGLDKLVRPLQQYSQFAQDSAYGWSRLTFHNCTHLTHEFVASRNGSVLDTATLYKDRKCVGENHE